MRILLETCGWRGAERPLASVDAVIVETRHGDQVFTLRSADQPYRVFIEHMHEGAICILPDGTISYANHSFADLVHVPLEQVIGSIYDSPRESTT